MMYLKYTHHDQEHLDSATVLSAAVHLTKESLLRCTEATTMELWVSYCSEHCSSAG